MLCSSSGVLPKFKCGRSSFLLLTLGVVLSVAFVVRGAVAQRSLRASLVRNIALTGNDNYFDHALAGILKPRVVGTADHEKVKKFIIKELEKLAMDIELDEFVDKPPGFGNLKFTNVVGRSNKYAKRFLTLACHYDSKYFTDRYFEAATDSAVPCAMLLNVAKALKAKLSNPNNDLGLMLIFFDGEEAFKEWNEQDSLYGSRHLADLWDRPQCAIDNCPNELSRIDLFVLLDLIGSPRQKFFSFFDSTFESHLKLYSIEKLLGRLGVLNGNNFMFFNKRMASTIDDDHRPFLKKKVPILHIIPVPFPTVWHTTEDNAANLSRATIDNFNKILRVFVYEYLDQEADDN